MIALNTRECADVSPSGGLRSGSLAPGSWQVFDRAERYLGTVRIQLGSSLFQVSGGKPVGRWTDEVAVEFVRVCAVQV